MKTEHELDEARVRQLLAPLARISPASRRVRRPSRPLRVSAVAVSGAVIVGGAAASGLGPFDGISAADRVRSPEDALPASVSDELDAAEAPSVDQIGTRLPEQARLVGQLPSGRKVYVVPSSEGRLCVIVASLAGSCGEPLASDSPITATTVDADGPGGAAPVSYGVARDGVASVTVGGSDGVRVPVRANFWFYEGSADLSKVEVGFADGSTKTIGDGS